MKVRAIMRGPSAFRISLLKSGCIEAERCVEEGDEMCDACIVEDAGEDEGADAGAGAGVCVGARGRT